MAAAASTTDALAQLIYLGALGWVPRGGGIAEVDRQGDAVLIYGRQPGGLRGAYHESTCVQADVTDAAVTAIVLGGRPGITPGAALFAIATEGQPLQAVADEVVARISQYLASSTS